MYGGREEVDYFPDMWILDIESKTWREVNQSGPLPPHRDHHSAAYYKGRLFIWGECCCTGQGSLSYLVLGDPENRVSQRCLIHSGRLLIWGEWYCRGGDLFALHGMHIPGFGNSLKV